MFNDDESAPASARSFTVQKPIIFPGRVSHTRLFPAFHTFSYSYLLVGVPVRSSQSNWLLSVDEARWWSKGWLQVLAEDHLDRSEDRRSMSLSSKLDQYLKSVVCTDKYLAFQTLVARSLRVVSECCVAAGSVIISVCLSCDFAPDFQTQVQSSIFLVLVLGRHGAESYDR